MITAVTLAVLYLLGAAAYAAWGVHAIAQGTPWVLVILGAVAAYFAVPFAAVTYWFALAWVYRSPRPPDKRIGLWRATRCYFTEVRCIAGSPIRMGFCWWLMREPAPAPAGAPVLLLHGVGCNAGMWVSFMQRLRERGIGPLYTLSYGPPLASIEIFAAQLAEKVAAIRTATGASGVTLLCHSMGGLVARAYLRRYGTDGIRAVVTIGTPHRGSILAGMFPGTCLVEMRPGGDWLERLNRDAPPPGVRCVALWSWHDSMVIPQLNARWDGAANVDFVGVAHNALLADAGVLACAAELLAKVEAEAAEESPPRR